MFNAEQELKRRRLQLEKAEEIFRQNGLTEQINEFFDSEFASKTAEDMCRMLNEAFDMHIKELLAEEDKAKAEEFKEDLTVDMLTETIRQAFKVRIAKSVEIIQLMLKAENEAEEIRKFFTTDVLKKEFLETTGKVYMTNLEGVILLVTLQQLEE